MVNVTGDTCGNDNLGDRRNLEFCQHDNLVESIQFLQEYEPQAHSQVLQLF